MQRLRSFQEQSEWTLERLAEEMGVESSYLGRVLREERPVTPRILLGAMKLGVAEPNEAA